MSVEKTIPEETIPEVQKNLARQFVCFKLASEEYAINIMDVREVIRLQNIRKVPQMPEFTLGVMNIRGLVIPIFDMRIKLHLAQKEMGSHTKIIVASVDQYVFGMIVDEILENLKLDPSQIDPTPNIKMSIGKECLDGLGELENRMIALLNLRKVHEEIKTEIEEFNSSQKKDLSSELN